MLKRAVLSILLLVAFCLPALAQPHCEDCGGGGCTTMSFTPASPDSSAGGVLLKYVSSTCTTLTLDVVLRNWSGSVVPDVLSIIYTVDPAYAVLSGYNTTGSWFISSSTSQFRYVEVNHGSNGQEQVYANRGNCDYFCPVGPPASFSDDKLVVRLTYTKVASGTNVPITMNPSTYAPVLHDNGGACDCTSPYPYGWVRAGTMNIY
jgi:hypothetical protein